MKQKFAHLIHWIRTHRTRSIIIFSVVLVIIASAVTFSILNQKGPVFDRTPIKVKPRPKPVIYYSPITGLPVSSEADRTKPVTAIVIENSPDARPQSGLKDAETVYEAIAEGGITRFAVIYQQNKPELIGPVRSLRPYYVDWMKPYDASIAHVGGSAAALAEVRNGSYRDIDQFFNAGTYWRASDRYAPHNVYTNFERLDALNSVKGYKTSAPKEYARADIKPSAAPDASTINVAISSPTYNSSYTYDATNKFYVRSQAGAPHVDREKGVITPKVVVVLNVDESTVFQDTNRQEIQTTGSGVATIFQGGTVVKGTWERSSKDILYTFKDSEGKEVKLDRGQTWITAIPNGSGSVSWQ